MSGWKPTISLIHPPTTAQCNVHSRSCQNMTWNTVVQTTVLNSNLSTMSSQLVSMQCPLLFSLLPGYLDNPGTMQLASVDLSWVHSSSVFYLKWYTGLTYFRQSNAFSPSASTERQKQKLYVFCFKNGLKRKYTHARWERSLNCVRPTRFARVTDHVIFYDRRK